MSCHLRRVYVPSSPVLCLRANPSRGVPTCHSFSVSSHRSFVCFYATKSRKNLNPFNQSFILSSRYFFSILQQQCPSKASCRRQRIMADYVVVKISSPTHHGTPPLLTRPGDACHRCSLMSQVQEPFSNVAIFLVVSFGCCER